MTFVAVNDDNKNLDVRGVIDGGRMSSEEMESFKASFPETAEDPTKTHSLSGTPQRQWAISSGLTEKVPTQPQYRERIDTLISEGSHHPGKRIINE